MFRNYKCDLPPQMRSHTFILQTSIIWDCIFKWMEWKALGSGDNMVHNFILFKYVCKA